MPASKRKKNAFTAFSLSFLDIMFCGFGAVVLLVLIVNSQMVKERGEKHEDLVAAVERLKQEVKEQGRLVAARMNSLDKVREETRRLEGRSKVVLSEIKRTELETARFLKLSPSRLKDLRRLESELKSLDAKRKRLLARRNLNENRGSQALSITGQGYRQYITGLRLGGRRVLLLIDCSASMLDSSIVQILRLKNMPRQKRIGTRKWIQALRTARWILANLPLDSMVKVAVFNDEVRLIGGSEKRWIPVKDTAAMRRLAGMLSAVVPDKGTSLFHPFSLAASLSPGPDNIILLTDGLPTLGRHRKAGGRVTSSQRVKLFNKAVSRLPGGVPVNTILFPLEGDPMAPALFWKLAVKTKGAFLTPSRDWP